MSLLADPSVKIKEPKKRFLLIGLTASILLHLTFIVAYMWTPQYDFTPPIQAAPIVVTIVAPLASNKQKIEDTVLGDPQKEIIQQEILKTPPKEEVFIAQASPSIVPIIEAEKPSTFLAPKKNNKEVVKKSPPQNQTTESKIDKPTRKPVKPEQSKKKVMETSIKPEAKLKPVDPVKKNEPLKTESQAISQQAQSKKNITTSNVANTTAALRQGQLSENGRIAKISWQQALHAHLEKKKKYPRKAKRMKKRGTPVIRFTMDRNGHVINVSLIQSSGTSSLDKEAIDLVYRAQPLIKPPSSVTGNRLSLTVPINFSF